MAYTKYSLTPSSNTAAPPDGAPEGMLPSAVNDTMRDMMAQIRDCGDGIRDGTYTMTAPKITGGTITGSTINNSAIGGTTAAAGTFTSLSDSGNLTFTGTGNRITGDFSNATEASRVAIQTSTTNGNTLINALPNGTATVANFRAYANSDPTNTAFAAIGPAAAGGEVRIQSSITGTGTYIPMTFYTGGSERLRIDTSGYFLINQSTTKTNYFGGVTTPLIQASALSTGTPAAATMSLTRWGNSAGASAFVGAKSRGTAIGTQGAVTSGDNLSQISFQGDDGTNFVQAALVLGACDGTVSTGIVPGRLVFSTMDTSGSLTERMRIDSSGNVGVNNTSPAVLATTTQVAIKANINGDSMFVAQNSNGLTTAKFGFQYTGSIDQPVIGSQTNHPFLFLTNNTERMRITSGGNLGVGTTAPDSKIRADDTANQTIIAGVNSNASFTAAGIFLQMSRNTTNNTFFAIDYYNAGASAYKFRVADSGNVTNTNNSYGSISDVKLKENIVDATPKLEDLCKVKVRQYNLKSDPEHKQIGVVAQELEEVFAGLVEETADKDREGNDLGTTTKQVKYSVFVPMLIKAVQEQQALIENLTTRLNALEGK